MRNMAEAGINRSLVEQGTTFLLFPDSTLLSQNIVLVLL